MAKKGKKSAGSHPPEEEAEPHGEAVEEVEEGSNKDKDNGDEDVQSVVKKAGEETGLEEVQERHRRELKEMRNECQRLKKQVTQGDKKKKKDVQAEIDALEASTAQRHQKELAAFEEMLKKQKGKEEEEESSVAQGGEEEASDLVGGLSLGTEKRVSKAQKKRARKEERDSEMRRQAEEEVANLPNLREIEDKKIAEVCGKHQLAVKQIPPDGHCLYNAVSDQLKLKGVSSVDNKTLRSQVAQFLRAHPDDYLPFMTDEEGDMLDQAGFKKYCDKLENTAEWGGQLEIQVISKLYRLPIFVVQGDSAPLTVGDEFGDAPLWLSYHRHAYGLGEHYNSLVPLAS